MYLEIIYKNTNFNLIIEKNKDLKYWKQYQK